MVGNAPDCRGERRIGGQGLCRFGARAAVGTGAVGFVDDAPAADGAIDPKHFMGPLEQLDDLAAACGVDRALVAAHSFDADELAELLSRRSGRIRHWIVLPPLQRFPSLWLEDCEAARMPALAITNRLALPWSRC